MRLKKSNCKKNKNIMLKCKKIFKKKFVNSSKIEKLI